jgi:hypothetical protein
MTSSPSPRRSWIPSGWTSGKPGIAAALTEFVLPARRREQPAHQPATAELLVKAFYAELSDEQRAAICFPWDHHDATRGLLRNFIANHWQVTRPCIRSAFFSSAQQGMIHDIFRGLVDPAWYPQFLRQLADDTKGHLWGQDQSVAIFGDPNAGPYQFLFTGRHLTLRAGVGEVPEIAFGGPIVYGHAATGYWEEPQHPGNIFWPQALAVSALYAMLDQRQREIAEVEHLPEESDIGFGAAPRGLSAATLSAAQRSAFASLLRTLAAPFRAEDRDRIARCLAQQGGIDRLHIALSRARRMSAPHWDIWRIEGPAFVWHFEGWPHVHAWVHVAGAPGLPVNAHRGAFIFPEHDPLQ